MAVGGAYGEPVAEWWDGSAWSVESVPSPAGLAEPSLNSVSCTSGSACTAVGSYSAGGLTRPLAERWDGSSWTLEQMPEPAGVIAVQLSQVSCASPIACIAAGFYTASKGQYFSGTLIERWDGVNWSEQSTPGDFGLNSVSCSSSSACTAVGDSQSPTGAYGAVVERLGRSGWMLSRLPGGVGLSAVSCSSSVTCTALGTGAGSVTAYRSAPASATLTGVPAGCVSAPLTVTITGLGISSVTWSLGRERIKGRRIRRGSRYAAAIRLSPGTHKLLVKVKFQAYTDARARTFRRIVVGCPATH
jgi:hypothetical protein